MRLQYPSDVRIIQVPCTGKVDIIHLLQAFEAGAEFLLASAAEAAGLVSSETALVLTQRLTGSCTLPVFVRGGVGPVGAAALYAAGCQGCVLDSQVVLAAESPLSAEWRERLSRCSPFDTDIVGDLVGSAFRAYVAQGQDEFKRLRAAELDLGLADLAPGDLEREMRRILARQ